MKKQTSITIRLDNEELKEIKRKANAFNMNSSEYARFCVNNAIKQNYIPKTRIMYFLHKIYTDAELQKQEKLSKMLREFEESCL